VNEDYLWDRSGPEDPEIARLERALGTLRASEPPAPLRLAATPAAPLAAASDDDRAMPGLGRFVLPFAVAATIAMAVASLWLSVNPYGPRPSWQISRLDGAPRVASRAMAEPTGQLPVGEWVETDGQARARIRVAHIGHVDVEPDSQVGLMSTRAGNYRLRLERGALSALILAPPGQFHVETPAAVAIDLGCAYRLQVKDDGESELRVSSGWVSLERQPDSSPTGLSPRSSSAASSTATSAATSNATPGATVGASSAADRPSSFVRSGAMCLAKPGVGPRTGPGTPFMEDVSADFRVALQQIDFGDERGDALPDQARAAAFDRVLVEARPADAITLWHLLARLDPRGNEVDRTYRVRLFDRLAAFVPPPKNVTREAIQTGESDLLDRWWDASRLGPRRGR
jgi:hypothetical protein